MTKRYSDLDINQKINVKGNGRNAKGPFHKTFIGSVSRSYANTLTRDYGQLNQLK